MKPSELILRPDGSLYHLHLKSGELATRIIFVGDPERVTSVASHFSSITTERRNREFYTVTGVYQNLPLSVISTGIGTDNIDIVWNEIDALFNIDLDNRKVKTEFTRLKVLRLGTCGGMQADIDIGSLVNSYAAIGADGLMSFYETEEDVEMIEALNRHFSASKLPPLSFYTSRGSESFSHLLKKGFPQVHQGITFTAAGFYGPQGRKLGRLSLRYPHLPQHISTFRYQGYKVLNMEMETSAILGLARALGHEAASLSVILANRQQGTFASDPPKIVDVLIRTGLQALKSW